MYARSANADLAASPAIRFSIMNARQCHKQRKYAEAILNYVAVLKSLQSGNRARFLSEFLESLRAYFHQELNVLSARDIVHISRSIYGKEFGFWRVVAEYYFLRGKLLKSIQCFENGLKYASTDLEKLNASISIENVKSNLFDAWHWRMVNDGDRNNKFASAINAALANFAGAIVLDIGCGSGILSVITARNGNKTLACDRSEVMCSIASNCFKRSDNIDNINLFETHSKDLDLSLKCDLLITETLDCAIFGERIVDTIIDAKQRLLSPEAIIIPNMATALFALIESIAISRENFYEHTDSAITLISSSTYIPDAKGAERILPPSPYTCAHVNELPNPGHSYHLLSLPVEGLTVDFTNMQQLKQIQNDRFLTEVIIEANKAGNCSAVCVWFRLNLYKEIEICTDPSEDYCWQQAIFPFYPPIHVVKGRVLRFEVFIKDHALRVQPTDIPASTMELLRAPESLDLLAMNDESIRDFFLNATCAAEYSQILDCTDLLINESKFPIVSNYPAIRYIANLSQNMNQVACKPGGAILFWPFSSAGTLLDEYFSAIVELHIRSPNTMLIPCKIVLKGCLINSDQLCKRSCLLDASEQEQAYCGVDLSPMDQYRIAHFHEIETRTLYFDQMSESVELLSLQFDTNASKDLSQLTRMGLEALFLPNRVGTCHAILHWFECFDPSGARLDLREDTFACKSSAFIFPKPLMVMQSEGLKLKTKFSLNHGNILFHSVEDVLFL